MRATIEAPQLRKHAGIPFAVKVLLLLTPLVVLIGALVRRGARLRGGGTALPGRVVQQLDPRFLQRALEGLRMGVVVIAGTNGKTTTTKTVVELLRSQGVAVVTNASGSNLPQGIISDLLPHLTPAGRVRADIAVLELDEAHAANFAQHTHPRQTLILNVFRDQLDRFGEIDSVARKLQALAEATEGEVVLNRDDPRVARLAAASKRVRYFGHSPTLRRTFPSDDDLHGGAVSAEDAAELPADVTLLALPTPGSAEYRIDGGTTTTTVPLRLPGAHNALNAAAALALVRAITADTHHSTDSAHTADSADLLRALSRIEPAAGRGELFHGPQGPVQLLLVKNPAGFRLALRDANPEAATMIAINDNDADGRDTSWLWDVDFHALHWLHTASGSRAHQVALRMQYDEIPTDHVDTNLTVALQRFLTAPSEGPKRIYASYTAMRVLRPQLSGWEHRHE